MADWALLLRGVNLGKHNRLSMAVLRELLTDLGHSDVRTVLASGNATFASPRRSADALAREVRDGLRERVDFDLPALVLSTTQVGQLLADVPSGEAGYRLVVHTSKLQTARMEKSLGVAMTARTPATLEKLLR